MYIMQLSGKIRLSVSKTGVLGFGVIIIIAIVGVTIERAFIIFIVIEKEVVKTKTNFLVL